MSPRIACHEAARIAPQSVVPLPSAGRELLCVIPDRNDAIMSGGHRGLTMLRRPKTVEFWVGRLPHWEVEDGRYFVTIHLAGAIPAAGRRRIRELSDSIRKHSDMAGHPSRKLQRMVFSEMERWLDRAEYMPLLSQPPVAEMVVEAIQHRSSQNVWNMFEFVLMPNHIHLFFELRRPGLKQVLAGFKEWTGRRACELLGWRGRRFWQRERFDHWSRSTKRTSASLNTSGAIPLSPD